MGISFSKEELAENKVVIDRVEKDMPPLFPKESLKLHQLHSRYLATIADIRAVSEARRAMLEKHQWASGDFRTVCPECHRDNRANQGNHFPDCALATLIKKEAE